MSRRPRGTGLRTRLLGALLLTSVVTLGVAALALLPPLQHRLRDQARSSLRATALATTPALQRALSRPQPAGIVREDVEAIASTLAVRTGARVAIFDGVPRRRYDTGRTPDSTEDVYATLARDHVIQRTTGDVVRVAVPLRISGETSPPQWVLALRKTDTGAAQAVDEVRSAFAKAAIAGLGVALLLGIALSTTLSRRLSRLRRAALRLAQDGMDAPAPRDQGADEVGDLARALASMQEALRRQEEARRAFVATASHELRTPLTSLQGNLELLAEDLDDPRADFGDAREQLRGAQRELRRLGNLATELLDLSRLDAGVALRHEPVELGELCRAVGAEFALRARDRGVDVDVVPPTGPVWASGDPGAVARIVRILLDNALRFSPAGQAIRVTAAYHGERATVEVADRGPGVPPAERDVIFERFQRGSRTGGEGGFGLGLAIGRELARRLGGDLTLVSQTQAGGARFVVTLPIQLPRGSGDGSGDGDVEAGEATAGERPPAVPSADE